MFGLAASLICTSQSNNSVTHRLSESVVRGASGSCQMMKSDFGSWVGISIRTESSRFVCFGWRTFLPMGQFQEWAEEVNIATVSLFFCDRFLLKCRLSHVHIQPVFDACFWSPGICEVLQECGDKEETVAVRRSACQEMCCKYNPVGLL